MIQNLVILNKLKIILNVIPMAANLGLNQLIIDMLTKIVKKVSKVERNI